DAAKGEAEVLGELDVRPAVVAERKGRILQRQGRAGRRDVDEGLVGLDHLHGMRAAEMDLGGAFRVPDREKVPSSSTSSGKTVTSTNSGGKTSTCASTYFSTPYAPRARSR